MNPGTARQLVAGRLAAAGLAYLHAPATVDPATPPVALIGPAEWSGTTATVCGQMCWLVPVVLVGGDPAGMDDPVLALDSVDQMLADAWPQLRQISAMHGSTVDTYAGRYLARLITVEVLA